MSKTATVETLSPAEVQRLLDEGRILLVDVREPAEFANERIHGALLFPLSTFEPNYLPPDGERFVVFHCGSGKRSLAAATRRLESGASRAAHMAGGVMGWKAAGLPVIGVDPATGTPTGVR